MVITAADSTNLQRKDIILDFSLLLPERWMLHVRTLPCALQVQSSPPADDHSDHWPP